MRLNKYISHNSKYSRREADRLIEAGEVKIGQHTIHNYSCDVTDDDKIFVKGRLLTPRKKGEITMIVYNKSRGVLVSKKDDRGRATIYHKLPGRFRDFIPVGRLDYASEGLLLLTDSPEVADILMKSRLPRTYNIKIVGSVSDEMIVAMKEGLNLEDAKKGAHKYSKIKSMEFSPFASYSIRGRSGKYTKLRVTITEGKNRELRRFFAHFGAEVLDLKRVAFGEIELNNLPENKTPYYTRREYDALHKFLKEAKRNDKHSV